MTKLGISLAALLVSAASMATAQDMKPTVQNADQIRWADAPAVLPKGAQVAVLMGDPAKEGPFAMRVKFPANYKIPPHTHPADEVVTVMEGDFHVGMGSAFDPGKADGLTPGGFMAMPKGMQHYTWSTGGAVVQINSQGPWGLVYVNPADDPRKSQ